MSLGLYDPLTRLAARYKSDKGVTVFPFNGYSVHYARLFERFRNQSINILEIGLARRTDRQSLKISCPSLSMWLKYFTRAKVYGFDIEIVLRLAANQICSGDRGNIEDLQNVVTQCSTLISPLMMVATLRSTCVAPRAEKKVKTFDMRTTKRDSFSLN